MEFFRDFVLSGTLHGFGPATDPAGVAARLGDDFLDDSSGGMLRRDYGLVEFYWETPALNHISVQAHRLAHGPRRYFGRLFPARVPFAALAAPLDEITLGADRPSYRRFRCADSGVTVIVMDDPADGPRRGDVWSMHTDWSSRPVAPVDGSQCDVKR